MVCFNSKLRKQNTPGVKQCHDHAYLMAMTKRIAIEAMGTIYEICTSLIL